MLLLHHAEWHSVVYNDLKGTLILILLRYDTLSVFVLHYCIQSQSQVSVPVVMQIQWEGCLSPSALRTIWNVHKSRRSTQPTNLGKHAY